LREDIGARTQYYGRWADQPERTPEPARTGSWLSRVAKAGITVDEVLRPSSGEKRRNLPPHENEAASDEGRQRREKKKNPPWPFHLTLKLLTDSIVGELEKTGLPQKRSQTGTVATAFPRGAGSDPTRVLTVAVFLRARKAVLVRGSCDAKKENSLKAVPRKTSRVPAGITARHKKGSSMVERLFTTSISEKHKGERNEKGGGLPVKVLPGEGTAG